MDAPPRRQTCRRNPRNPHIRSLPRRRDYATGSVRRRTSAGALLAFPVDHLATAAAWSSAAAFVWVPAFSALSTTAPARACQRVFSISKSTSVSSCLKPTERHGRAPDISSYAHSESFDRPRVPTTATSHRFTTGSCCVAAAPRRDVKHRECRDYRETRKACRSYRCGEQDRYDQHDWHSTIRRTWA